jgi:hypothetical protein
MLSHESATICEGRDEAGAADHLGSPEVSNAVKKAAGVPSRPSTKALLMKEKIQTKSRIEQYP